MVANGYGVTLVPQIAVDVEAARRARQGAALPRSGAGAHDRACVAAHLAAQGRLRGARPDRARNVRRMKRVAVIGAGPAGLMAAEVLARGGAQVTVYDRMPSAGRKFLMAGRGGLNLTHSEALAAVPRALRRGARRVARRHRGISAGRAARRGARRSGQPTFVGSSGRVFPRAMKASPLLRAWLRRLDAAGVRFALRHHWVGWDDDGASCSKRRTARSRSRPTRPCWRSAARAGRGSARTAAGPTCSTRAGVAVAPLQPSNCGFLVAWSEHLSAASPGSR